MCMRPCGPVRSYRSSAPKLAKYEVRDMINSYNYECIYRKPRNKVFIQYDGSCENLLDMLKDSRTSVKNIGIRSVHFLAGYTSVLMNVPYFGEIIIRTKLLYEMI